MVTNAFDEVFAEETPKANPFDEVFGGEAEESVTQEAPAGPDMGKLRSETFQMLKDARRLSPRVQQTVADEDRTATGAVAQVVGAIPGSVGEALGSVTEDVLSGPSRWFGEKPETGVLNEMFGGKRLDAKSTDDIKEFRAGVKDERTAKTLDSFISYFEGNGIADGKQMAALMKDAIKENTWDATTDDTARVLSDGSLRVNPKFVALPDAQEGIKAIMAAPTDDATREQEIERFKAARTQAAAAFDKKTRTYDEDYRAYAEQQEAKGITDPEQIFYNWPGLNRNWIEGSWDVVRDTVAQSGRNIYNTAVRTPAMGLAQVMGDTESVERIGRDILASSTKSGFTRDIAAARGQGGAIVGTGKELGTTVLDMIPMFAGAGASRIIAGGAEASAARKFLGKVTQGASVYGYAGAQGYASLMQTALESAEAEAKAARRELTGQEINDTVKEFQGAALGNAFQTILLTKLNPGGSEAAATRGLTASAKEMTGRDVIDAFRRNYGDDGVRAAIEATKPELVKFAKQVYGAAKEGFKDEAIEEGVNQYVEGVITMASGANPDLTWDQIGQDTFKGAWMGGVVGGGLPAAREVLARRDPAEVAAQKMAVAAEPVVPDSAKAAMEPITPTPTPDEQPVEPTVAEAADQPVAPGTGDVAGQPAPTEPVGLAPTGREAVAPPSQGVEGAVGPGQPSVTGLTELGAGAGKAIAANFYDAIEKSVAEKGEVPSAEKNTRVGKAWGVVRKRTANTPEMARRFAEAVKKASAEGDTAESWAAAMNEAFPAVEPGQPVAGQETGQETGQVEPPKPGQPTQRDGEVSDIPAVTESVVVNETPVRDTQTGLSVADETQTALMPSEEDTVTPGNKVTRQDGLRGEVVSESDGNLQVEWSDGTVSTVRGDQLKSRSTKTSRVVRNRTSIVQSTVGGKESFTVMQADENGLEGAIQTFTGETDEEIQRAYSRARELAKSRARSKNHGVIVDLSISGGGKQIPVPAKPPSAGEPQVSDSPTSATAAASEPVVGDFQTPATPQTDATQGETETRAGEPAGPVSQGQTEESLTPAPYSKDAMVETMGVTPEQAEAVDALIQASGLDVSRVVMTRGGTSGSGLRQEGGALTDAEYQRHADLEARKDSLTPEELREAEALVEKAARGTGYTMRGARSSFYSEGGVPLLPESSSNLGSGYYAVLGGTEADVAPYAESPAWRVALEAGAVRRTGEVFIKAENPFELSHPSFASQEIRDMGRSEDFSAWLDLQAAINKGYIEAGGKRPESLESRRGSGISPNTDGGVEIRDSGKAFSYLFDRGLFDSAIVDWDAAAKRGMRAGDSRAGKEIVVANPEQIKSADPFTGVPLRERFNPESPSILYQFAGEKANVPQFMRDSLDTAKAMAAEGKDSETIRAVTGWFPGMDGKMRWEIPDEGVSLQPEWSNATRLGDLVNHPALFEAYPELAESPVEFRRWGNSLGVTADGKMTIPEMVRGFSSDDLLGSVLHEVQHLIQQKEGFAVGGNLQSIYGEDKAAIQREVDRLSRIRDEAKARYEADRSNENLAAWKSSVDAVWDAMGQKPVKRSGESEMDYYTRLAGEIEARDVQARRTMTPEQRAAVAPYSTQNIAPEDAIILFQRTSRQAGKGSIDFLRDGTVLIRGLQSPDVSTAAHEFAHLIRRQLLNRDAPAEGITAEDIETVEKWAGAKDGTWSVAAEEKFARGWERYLADGKAPVARLQEVFDKFAKWLGDIYGRIAGSPIDIEITPEVRAVMDKLVTRNMGKRTEVERLQELDSQIEQELEPAQPEPRFNAPFDPEGPTSLKHAQTDADRARLGMPPRMTRPATTDEDAWSSAVAAEDAHQAAGNGGTAGAALLAKLSTQKPRALTKQEHALLLHEKLVREQEVEDANRSLNRLGADAAPETRLDAMARSTKAQEEFDALISYAEAAGSASGLSLQARKMLVSRDFSIATVVNNLHAAKNKNAKTPQEWTQLDQKKAVAMALKLQEAQERVDALEAENTELTAAVEQLTADVEQAQRKLENKVRESKARKLVKEKLDPMVAAAKARLEARGKVRPSQGTGPDVMMQSGITPEDAADLRDLAYVAAGYFVDKTLTLAEFSTRLVADFGTWVSEHVGAVFNQARSIYTETAESVTGSAAPTPEQVVDSIDAEKPLDRKDVWDLARAHVISGKRGRNVLTAVFGDLSPLFPDLTRDEVATLFTNYGKVVYPSKKEVPVELNRIRNLERIALKLADLRATPPVMPKRTGFQRGEQDPEVRELEKEFREALRESGLQVTDPEKQLQSALGAAKRRMQNEIEELQRAIDRRVPRISPSKGGIELDEEGERLKSLLATKREEYASIFAPSPKEVISEAQRMATRTAETWLARLSKSQSDTLEWAKKPTANPMAELLSEHVKSPVEGFIQQAIAIGATEDQARVLDSLISRERVIVERVLRAREEIRNSPEKRIAAVMKSLDRQIAEAEKMLADGVLKRPKGVPLSTSEIEEKRQRLADMRANRRALWEAQNPGVSTREQAKTAARKAIDRLSGMIARNDVAVKERKTITPDEELKALWEAREALSDEVVEMRKQLPLTPEKERQAIERALTASQRTLDKLRAKLDSGDLSKAPAKQGVAANDPAVIRVREQIKALNKELAARRRDALPKMSPEEAREKRFLAAAEKRRADLERRIREKDFARKPKPVPLNTEASRRANYELAKLRSEYGVMRAEYLLANSSLGARVWHFTVSTGNLLKLLTLGFDIGVLTRQLGTTYQSIVRDLGMFAPTEQGRKLRANGSYLVKTIRAGVEAFMDPKAEHDIYDAVMKRPNAGWDKAAGLVFGAPFDEQAGTREDIPTSNYIEQIPWWVWPATTTVKVALVGVNPPFAVALLASSLVQKKLLIALDRAQRAMTNQSRAMWFDHAVESMPGGLVSAEAAKQLGRAIMVGTGRGTLPQKMEGIVPAANQILLATRFYASRIQAIFYAPRTAVDVLTNFKLTNPEVTEARKEIAKMYARSVTGRALLLTLAAMAFGKSVMGDDDEEEPGVVLNPFNPDMGRVKLSDSVKLDFMSGINGFMGVIARNAFGRRTDPDTGRTEVFAPQDYSREVTNFFASKRNLTVSFFWNLRKGEFYGGKTVNFENALEEATTAIIVNDTVKAFQELGPVKGAALTTLMLLGAGTSVGDTDQEKQASREMRAAAAANRRALEAELNQ
jgi:hypothetical protein